MKKKVGFSVQHHVPKYSVVLLDAVKTPLLIYLALAGNFIMVVAAYLFFQFEHLSNATVTGYGDALWWAICTVSTVGYGDIVPTTTGGRWVGAFLIIFGVSFFLSFMAALVTVVFTNLARETFDESAD